MKNNTNDKEAEGNTLVKLPPLPADAEYRKERQQESALVDSTGERNIGNNENNEAPDNVGGAESMVNSATDVLNDVQKNTYNLNTWQMFHDL